jgi:hypothetical protein
MQSARSEAPMADGRPVDNEASYLVGVDIGGTSRTALSSILIAE